MMRAKTTTTAASDYGTAVALLFALVAERLSAFYEHGQWLSDARATTLVSDWLARSGRAMSLEQRRRLASLSDGMSRQMAATLSREAGLGTAHEMMQALDPHYHSELAETLMQTCAELLDASSAVDG